MDFLNLKANKSKLFKSQAEDITDSMFSADVIQSRSDSEEKPDKAEAAVSEKPAKKGWFSFSSAPPKDKKSQYMGEYPGEGGYVWVYGMENGNVDRDYKDILHPWEVKNNG